MDGIQTVSTFLSQGDLIICESCMNLMQEFESYVWDEKAVKRGEDKPLKQRDHALDALRYALFTHFGKRHSLKEITPEQAYLSSQQKRWTHNPMNYPGFVGSHGWQSYSGGF